MSWETSILVVQLLALLFAGVWGLYWRGAYFNLVASWEEEKHLRREAESNERAAEDAASQLRAGLAANEHLLIAQARIHEALVKERDELWTLHQASMAQLGNGQAMLAQQLSRLIREHNALRQANGQGPLQLDPTLEQVMKEIN